MFRRDPHLDFKGMHCHVESLGRGFQELEKFNLVAFAGKNSLAGIASSEEVIDCIFKL